MRSAENAVRALADHVRGCVEPPLRARRCSPHAVRGSPKPQPAGEIRYAARNEKRVAFAAGADGVRAEVVELVDLVDVRLGDDVEGGEEVAVERARRGQPDVEDRDRHRNRGRLPVGRDRHGCPVAAGLRVRWDGDLEVERLVRLLGRPGRAVPGEEGVRHGASVEGDEVAEVDGRLQRAECAVVDRRRDLGRARWRRSRRPRARRLRRSGRSRARLPAAAAPTRGSSATTGTRRRPPSRTARPQGRALPGAAVRESSPAGPHPSHGRPRSESGAHRPPSLRGREAGSSPVPRQGRRGAGDCVSVRGAHRPCRVGDHPAAAPDRVSVCARHPRRPPFPHRHGRERARPLRLDRVVGRREPRSRAIVRRSPAVHVSWAIPRAATALH